MNDTWRQRWAQAGTRAPRDRSRLSERHRQLMIWRARGYRTVEIAERLGVADATIRQHIGAIHRQLGVSDRMVALAILVSRGEIALHEIAPGAGDTEAAAAAEPEAATTAGAVRGGGAGAGG